jgi:TP901 family phage tail tape measure protein
MANILEVILKGDAKHLNSSLGKASRNLKSFGKRVSSLGSSLQTRLALPLVAAGGASIKMAADFDKSMTQIKTLVGVAGTTVDQMSVSVKRLATEAGISSGEAADALFFITSAGLRGAEAMAVLEQSTKAAAVGLGETKVIADLATSALNAYGVENLSASQATDVLTGAVREGKLSADTLAQSMGTVLPVASQLGVEFSEVGATFAAMSRTGTDAAMAATQIRGILFSLLKPSKQASDTLAEFGLSAEGLRRQIKEEGLLSTLKTLTTTFGDNEEAQGRVFANTRALSGVLDLMGKNLGSTEQIFKSMNNTAGITQKAFDQLGDSAEFKLRKGLIELKNQFTDLGGILMESLLPVLTDAIGFASKLFKAFGKLDPVVQQLTIGFAAFAAVLPTILTVGGALLTLLGSLSLPIVAVGAAIAGLIIYFDEIANAFVLFKNAVKFNVLAVLIKIDEYIQKYLIRPLKAAGRFLNEFIEEGFSGDFGGIMDDFFAEGEEISKKAGKQIAENFVDQWKQNSEERFEGTIDKLISKVQNKFSGILSGVGIKTPKVSAPEIETPKGEQDLGSIFAIQGNPFDEAGKGVEDFAKKSTTSFAAISSSIKENTARFYEMNEAREQTQQRLSDLAQVVGGQLMGAFSSLGDTIVTSMGLGEGALGSFAGAFITAAMDAIAASLAVATAAAIKGAAEGSFLAGPLAPIVLPALIAGGVAIVKSAFSSNVPKFANGGIVSAPTLGLMGEYAGARSNPEVIAPLDKLKGMIGQRETAVNVTGGFRLEGQDLVMALQRADRNRSRLL